MVKFNPFKLKFQALPLIILFTIFSCTENNNAERKKTISEAEKRFYYGKGNGPVREVKLSELDPVMAEKGKALFDTKCFTCHTVNEQRLIGPGLKGITLRRTPEWIMNQILDPIGMTQTDSLSKELLSIYMSQMTPMNLTEEESRNILEYLRQLDSY